MDLDSSAFFNDELCPPSFGEGSDKRSNGVSHSETAAGWALPRFASCHSCFDCGEEMCTEYRIIRSFSQVIASQQVNLMP